MMLAVSAVTEWTRIVIEFELGWPLSIPKKRIVSIPRTQGDMNLRQEFELECPLSVPLRL